MFAMYQFRRDRRFRHCRSADPPVYIFAVWHGLVPDHPWAGTAAAGVVIYPDDAVSYDDASNNRGFDFR
jgi:hypothetical protein